MVTSGESEGYTVTIERIERRFGITAVESGYATVDQILNAIKVQIMEDMEQGRHRIVGEILIDQGVMNPSQINDVLKTMGLKN